FYRSDTPPTVIYTLSLHDALPIFELLRFLTEHAFENIAQLAGWYAYAGRQMDATLGILQHFITGGEDGWDRALATMGDEPERFLDRKSTRLNSSHLVISYAVFCLK